MKLAHLISLGCSIAILTFLASCDNDLEFVTGDAVNLRFSVDTIMFDTVFTDRGSATQILTVYNDASEAVMIDRITVAGQTGVSYRFNANGIPGPVAEDVAIFGQDSMFVFVEVTIDPTAPEETSPFIAEDELVFEMGNSMETVHLMAFGQNANYLNGFRRGQFAQISCEGGIAALPVDLPTVIFGSLFVEDCTLRALAGTRIFFHGGIQRNEIIAGDGFFNDGFIFTQPTGRLEFLGTAENPVILSTDRLEPRFRDDPAKYRGIILGAESRGNLFQHTQILNSIVGISMDSLAEVTLENSTIAFTGGPAISGFQSDVTISNSLFHSNSGNSIQMIQGGNLTMDHTTIASFGVEASGLLLWNFALNADNEVTGVAPMRARINNSIIAGNRPSELIFADIFDDPELMGFDVSLSNSVVKTDDNFESAQMDRFANFYENICQNCVNQDFSDPLFRSTQDDDYRLDSLGLARNLGVFDPAFPVDIRGEQRIADSTDAGAFEFLPGEE